MTEWSGKKVLVIGAARQGTALARYLSGRGAQVVINDHRPARELQAAQAALADLPLEWVCGGHPLEVLEEVDLVCPSGGVPLTLPLIAEARRRGIPLSNDSQIFLENAPCRVIGITGSAGKTTTTTLVGRMALEAAQVSNSGGFPAVNQVWVGGNIGNPLIDRVDEMKPSDLAVIELSSFQLELMSRSPQVAAVLNITPNHLDRHGTMEAYRSAKRRILEFQTGEDIAVLNRDDPGAWSLADKVKGRLLSFGLDEPVDGLGTFVRGDRVFFKSETGDFPLLSLRTIELRGEHNLLNVLAAAAIAAGAGLPGDALEAGVAGFHGVPNRLEFVRTWGGADWYNDSIATAPERAMAAIRSFSEPLVLLAGGRDKDLPWEEFAALVHRRVDHVILFGEAAGKIAAAIEERAPGPANGASQRLSITRCSSLQSAVQAAAQVVRPGDVVLFSPGGTSFDEFHDFEERGEWYKKWVMQL